MGKEYWTKIRKAVEDFSIPGDNLNCIKVHYEKEGQNCQLCGHHPINWVHTLQNTRTEAIIEVGRECIHNYKLIHEKRYNTPMEIIYPAHYRKSIQVINDKWPGTVIIQPDIDNRSSDIDDMQYEDVEFYGTNFDDMTPEGMGLDEIDWDSFDWDTD